MGPPMFQKGQRIGEDGNRWIIVRKLGEGQFAEVYEVKDAAFRDRDIRHAMKIEKRRDIKSVKQELKILKRLQEACHSEHICDITESGMHDERFYIVMRLLGHNLAETQRKMPGSRFDVGTVRAIALCTLQAIEVVHTAGYIHRDIKPANFAICPISGEPAHSTWVVIDFGLARRYLDENGEVLPERNDAAFRGSTTYASINAHLEQDLGRRDDLWSWLYVLVELLDGTLPWRSDKDIDVQNPQHCHRDSRDYVHQIKAQCANDPTQLTKHVPLPEPLLLVSNYLRELNFGDKPDYDRIRSILSQLPAPPQPSSLFRGSMPHLQGAHHGAMRSGSPSPYMANQNDGTSNKVEDSSLSQSGYHHPQQGQKQHWMGSPATSARVVPPTPASPPSHVQLIADSPASPLAVPNVSQYGDAATVGYSVPMLGNSYVMNGAEVCDLPASPLISPDEGIRAPVRSSLPTNSVKPNALKTESPGSQDMLRSQGIKARSLLNVPASPKDERHSKRGPDARMQAVSMAWGVTRKKRESSGGGAGSAPSGSERTSLHDIMGCISALNLGMVSPEAQQVAAQLGALHPVDALTVMASVVHGAVNSVHPSGGHALAQALFDFSQFFQHAAEQADVKALGCPRDGGPME